MRLGIILILCGMIASGWGQNQTLVVASLDDKQAQNIPSIINTLKPLRNNRKGFEEEARKLGYSVVVWDSEVVMLFPDILTVHSHHHRALEFCTTLYEDLKQRNYHLGQAITSDEFSEATRIALARFLYGAEVAPTVLERLELGLEGFSFDVWLAPRTRDGKRLAFKFDILIKPVLSRLKSNAQIAQQSLSQLEKKWQKQIDLIRSFGEERYSLPIRHQAVTALYYPEWQRTNLGVSGQASTSTPSPSPNAENEGAKLQKQVDKERGLVSEVRLHFSHMLELETVERYSHKYWQTLNRIRRETKQRLQEAEWKLVQLFLGETATLFNRSDAAPVPLTQLPPELQQLVLEKISIPRISPEEIVVTPQDFYFSFSHIRPSIQPPDDERVFFLIQGDMGLQRERYIVMWRE